MEKGTIKAFHRQCHHMPDSLKCLFTHPRIPHLGDKRFGLPDHHPFIEYEDLYRELISKPSEKKEFEAIIAKHKTFLKEEKEDEPEDPWLLLW